MVPNILIGANETRGAARPHVLLPPSPGEQGQTFLDGALLDNTVHKPKKADWLISFAVHAAILAALVIVPLFFTQALDLTRSEITYLAPPPTPYAPPPPPAAVASVKEATRRPVIRPSTLTMPIAVPRKVEVLHDAASESADLNAATAGVPGGVVGGVPGGVLGGVLGSMGTVAPPPPPPPPPPPAEVASNGPLHIGGEVKSPRAISTPQPKYPLLALQARIEGDVQIDAVIDKNGNVVQERAMNGPPLLISAAVEAVKHWKYQPTYLNGEPWPVELTINVTFSLS
jgi:periplasmic protein TonB